MAMRENVVEEEEFAARRRRGLGQLVGDLSADARLLARQEIQLAKAEMLEAIDDLKAAAASLVGAVVVGIAGLGVTLLGVAFVLAEVMELWLATLIVGGAALLIAIAMGAVARSKVSADNMRPRRTESTLRSHANVAEDKIKREQA